MTSKQDLIDIIKKWLEVDKELKKLAARSRELRVMKKELTTELSKIMKDNEIDCFDVNAGKITHGVRKTKGPLNKKLLMSALDDYFRDSPTHAGVSEELTQFILSKRQIKETDFIKIK